MTLHCSFEHFERDEDSKFIIEAARLLQPHGKLCILPLYFADEYSILTDPTVNRRGVKWDQDATIYNKLDYRNRFGRFYTVQKLKDRVLDHWRNFSVKFFFVENEKEIHQSCYLNFVLVLEKSPGHDPSKKMP
jgi:predicted SAM-dependent methyltransferase